jgi:hypothetical protein
MRRRVAAALVAVLPALFVVGHGYTASATTTILSGNVTLPGLTVNAGDVVELDPNTDTTVTVTASVVVYGTLRMRPANAGVDHVLRFTGVNESSYVGGGDPLLASDVGLWVEGAGQLDISGTPRAGWNRTGSDPSWLPGDQLVSAPFTAGDYTANPFTAGSAVPTITSPSGATYANEVANLTRNVSIEGTASGRAHIRIKSTVPQTVKYAQIRYMGPRKDTTGDGYLDPVAGREPLHFHRNDNGSAGTLIEGVVIRDTGGDMTVDLHRSHGITVRDTVLYRVEGEGFGWEMVDADATNNTLLEHNLALDLTQANTRCLCVTKTAFALANGTGNIVRDSAAAGVVGGKSSSGFEWPSGSPSEVSGGWDSHDIVAHNNRHNGIFVWQNSPSATHDVVRAVTYRNGFAGVAHGAYSNAYLYDQLDTFANTSWGLKANAKSNDNATRPLEFRGGYLGSVLFGDHSTPYLRHGLMTGQITDVTIDEAQKPESMRWDLVGTGLQRSAVTVASINPQTVVRVRNGADCWQVTPAGISTIACF